jgi:hypothetical protein
VLVGYLAWQRRWVHAVVAGAISAAGVVAVTLYFTARYDRWFAQYHAQDLWNRQLTWPFHPFVWSIGRIIRQQPVATPDLESNAITVFLLNDLMVAAAVVGVMWLVISSRRDARLWPLAAFAALYVLLIVSNGPSGRSPEAAGRLLMCAVPLMLFPARLRSERTWTLVIAASAGAAMFFQAMFNLNYWFT